jgi:hypothetical protein
MRFETNNKGGAGCCFSTLTAASRCYCMLPRLEVGMYRSIIIIHTVFIEHTHTQPRLIRSLPGAKRTPCHVASVPVLFLCVRPSPSPLAVLIAGPAFRRLGERRRSRQSCASHPRLVPDSLLLQVSRIRTVQRRQGLFQSRQSNEYETTQAGMSYFGVILQSVTNMLLKKNFLLCLFHS